MPIAVTVDRNGFGDWLAAAANTVKDAISPSLKMMGSALMKVPHPKSQLLGMGMSMLGGREKAFLKQKTEAGETKAAAKIVKKLTKESHITPSAGTHGN